jgi:hypothetical protein
MLSRMLSTRMIPSQATQCRQLRTSQLLESPRSALLQIAGHFLAVFAMMTTSMALALIMTATTMCVMAGCHNRYDSDVDVSGVNAEPGVPQSNPYFPFQRSPVNIVDPRDSFAIDLRPFEMDRLPPEHVVSAPPAQYPVSFLLPAPTRTACFANLLNRLKLNKVLVRSTMIVVVLGFKPLFGFLIYLTDHTSSWVGPVTADMPFVISSLTSSSLCWQRPLTLY